MWLSCLLSVPVIFRPVHAVATRKWQRLNSPLVQLPFRRELHLRMQSEVSDACDFLLQFISLRGIKLMLQFVLICLRIGLVYD